MKYYLAPIVIAVSLLCAGTTATATAATNSRPLLVQGLPNFTTLVQRVGPSVVNIRTLVKPTKAAPKDNITPLDSFIDPPQVGPLGPTKKGSEELVEGGLGSGFIISTTGYIMTNAHVVKGAIKLIVTLADEREFAATLVGSDTASDVAIVRIDASGLTAVMTGNAEELSVGEWVMAIGSPFGLENTVTSGIVSAKHRDIGDLNTFIQTDVAINPGNSGGPLINMRGEVVGINSQIYSRSGGFMGISFSIPIGEALYISKQLIATGKVWRGRIGLSVDSVSKELTTLYFLARNQGALVREVVKGSAAEAGGVLAGDIVLKFNDNKITHASDLPRFVGNTLPGTVATMIVLRNGTTQTLKIKVGVAQE